MNVKMNHPNNVDYILVVEDSPTQAEQLSYLLEKNDYVVVAATNGNIALECINERKPMLIISDIVMPEMNGYELCKEIKASEKMMDIPVILLTALTRTEDVLEGISCGADNFITKPYSEDYLISHVQHILSNRNIYKNERVRIGVEIMLGGKRRFITAGQQQMLTLLLSSYEAAVQRNEELVQTQDDLRKINEHLEELVAERTAELSSENAIRKRAEERIIKLNRVYAVLSNINQAIVRIHDPNQLLKDACMIAIDVGKFQSAWIGIINNDTKKIETFATAGSVNNLIDVDYNSNPIVNALNIGNCFISNDIKKDKSLTEIWKRNSLAYGYQSFAAFPLKGDGKIIGCYCIYSNEVNFFDEQEISLLSEMATDISFALEYIRNEEKRKRTEEELRRSEEKFSSAFRSASYALTITRLSDGKIIEANDSFYSITGYTTEEVTGKTSVELNLWEDENNRKYVISELLKGNSISSKTFSFNKKSGDTIVGLFSAEIISIQNEKCILSSINDITDRKQAEEEIIFQKNKFAQLFDNSPIAIVLLDDEDRIVLTNESFTILFGYFLDEIKGKPLSDSIVPPELRVEAKSYSDLTRGGNYINKESYRRKKDGSNVYVQIIGVPVTLNDKIIGIYGMYVDLTQRKKVEEELIKAKEHSEEMNKLKNCFLTNMSHELRTPLISVLGFAELLQNELENQEHLAFVNNIIEGGQRLNNTLCEILEISKLETAKSFLKLKPYNLANEIKQRAISFTPMAQAKRLFLKTELSDTYMMAQIDSELFGKAIFHLVNNAVKFTKVGGVFISLHHERKEDLDWAVITIIDTGIGISKHNLEKIFSEFRQVDEGYSRGHEGTGLGLTIAKRIVELMKGFIQVESEVGKGTTFSIWLPAILDENQIKMKVEERGKTTFVKPPTTGEKGLKTALIVDDNSSNRLFMNHCLAAHLRIIEAQDGITGVTLASKEQFDLILMDINLGEGIDGVEAMNQIRKIPGYMHVPIIAVTAYAMIGDRERFLSEGFDFYLAKPFTKNTLLSLVENSLQEIKK
ncbi:MAG: hypothetical protein A2279_02900 [Stygiobacter sp. RIFOXYA12_FULL_38_9]|nr:MAG: hypothetical protein A2279_02900 [Stygiobacter sp. RIFOXYA12_FULL_38_9]